VNAAARVLGLRAPRRVRPAARGFTLIEILVVLVIAGVLVGALALAYGGSAARELQTAAERSRGLILLACERAVLGGRDIGFAPSTRGMRFGYYELDGWRELEGHASDELRLRPWGEGVEVRAERDGEPLVLGADAPAEPPFACLSSGELTPLRLVFSRPDAGAAWQLEGRLDGTLELGPASDAP
jgi:general secretion pathway protein H